MPAGSASACAPRSGCCRSRFRRTPGGFWAATPRDLAGLVRWEGAAGELARAVATAFPSGAAVVPRLAPPPGPLAEGAFENSPAARQADHTLLRAAEAEAGRGPLWRVLGIAADLEAALSGRLPAPLARDGVAAVQAARGTYGLRLTEAGGIVTGLARRTPTDHMLAPGGALIRALRTLPDARRALAPLVIALNDPCIPVWVREAEHA